MHVIIIRLALWAGKINQILRCDWLPERVDDAILPARARDYPLCLERKNSRKPYINHLLIKPARSECLDIGLVLFLRAGDVKEPTRLSQRVGHEVPGVVIWPLLLKWGLRWEMLGDISYHKATLQSEGKHSILLPQLMNFDSIFVPKHATKRTWLKFITTYAWSITRISYPSYKYAWAGRKSHFPSNLEKAPVVLQGRVRRLVRSKSTVKSTWCTTGREKW